MEPLGYIIPPFVRNAWGSAQAKEAWELHFFGIKQAWHVMKLTSVREGIRDCALVTTPDWGMPQVEKRAGKYGLSFTVLQKPDFPYLGEVPEKTTQFVVLGASENISTFRAVWQQKDHDEIGRLLGYPACCRASYQRCMVEHGYRDFLWPMAAATVTLSIHGVSGKTREFKVEPGTNMAFYRLGVKPVLHFPCSFDCQETIDLSDRFRDLGRAVRFGGEIEALTEILSWPVEWSALHGIAEVKNPVLKASWDTDTTGEKYTIRLRSNCFPAAGVRGAKFPYR